ncbi:MAG: hypothetical protein ACQERD_02840 [Campylobacterota bacterium]
MKQKETFTILGTGWLGYALANSLKDSYDIKVSIRDNKKYTQLKHKGFEPYILNEYNMESLNDLLTCDYLFVNYPPSKFEDYMGFLNKIYSHYKIDRIKKIIFISSTSIYPKENNNYTESFKIKKEQSKEVVFQAEKVASKSDVIFRCAGLMGYDRVAGKYFSNKKVSTANKRINHVHRDDVINATKFVIKNDLKGIFNLCSAYHPTKIELYLTNAEKYGFDKPIFEEDSLNTENNRLIDGTKIESLGFKYQYPNPLEYFIN